MGKAEILLTLDLDNPDLIDHLFLKKNLVIAHIKADFLLIRSVIFLHNFDR